NVVDALKHVSGEVLRFFILNTHYRSPIDLGAWDPKNPATPVPSGLDSARKAYDGFMRFAERYQRITGTSFFDLKANNRYQQKNYRMEGLQDLHRRFVEFMDDDFNTGGATAVLFELLTVLNKYADKSKLEDAGPDATAVSAIAEGGALLHELGSLLG